MCWWSVQIIVHINAHILTAKNIALSSTLHSLVLRFHYEAKLEHDCRDNLNDPSFLESLVLSFEFSNECGEVEISYVPLALKIHIFMFDFELT